MQAMSYTGVDDAVGMYKIFDMFDAEILNRLSKHRMLVWTWKGDIPSLRPR